jgi:hypothetical protein
VNIFDNLLNLIFIFYMKTLFKRVEQFAKNAKEKALVDRQLNIFEVRLKDMLSQDIRLIHTKFVMPQYKTLRGDISKFLESETIYNLQDEIKGEYVTILQEMLVEISSYIEEYEEAIGIGSSARKICILRNSYEPFTRR